MTSLTKAIWTEIEEDVVVRRALEKGIISLKNLAVYLQRKKKIHGSSDAIISAIRRYKEEKPLEKKFEAARQVLQESEDVRITTNIAIVALEKNKETQSLLSKTFTLISYERGELLLINQGEQSIKLIINWKNQQKIQDIFSKKQIISVDNHIAQINIKLSDDAVKTPGIISVLTSELMMHEINMVEVMSCVPEMLLFVSQKDVVRAYEILYPLCSKHSE